MTLSWSRHQSVIVGRFTTEKFLGDEAELLAWAHPIVLVGQCVC